MPDQLVAAAAAVDRATAIVDTATQTLADASTDGGRVSVAKLDTNQILAYDLAHAASALEGCRVMLTYGEHGEVESMLARAFIAEAIADLGAKVIGRDALWGVDLDTLADALPFVEAHRSPQFLEAVAATLPETGTGPRHLSDEFELAADTFRRFAADKIRPVAEHVHRSNSDIPEDVMAGLAELGGFGLSVPEEYGGFASGGESDYLAMVVATEELSWGSLGVGGSLITRPEILTRAIVAGGTEAQKQRWLPRIASGELLVGVSVTEPDFGSDVAGVNTMATAVDGGFRINGVKTWATFAGRAELIMLLARTDPDRSAGHRGLSLFVVEKDAVPGHSFALEQDGGGNVEGRAIDTIGYRGMHSFEVSYADWFVPAENLVGESAGLGRGFYLQMEGFENGRLQTAGARRRADAGRVRRRARVRAGARRVRQAGVRLPVEPGEARAHGGVDPGRSPVLLRRRRPHGPGRGNAGGVDGEGIRVSRRGMGHPRGDATARRDGLRRGVPGVALLRGRAGAVDLRRRRRDAVPARDRPSAGGAGAGVDPSWRPGLTSDPPRDAKTEGGYRIPSSTLATLKSALTLTVTLLPSAFVMCAS